MLLLCLPFLSLIFEIERLNNFFHEIFKSSILNTMKELERILKIFLKTLKGFTV